MQRIGTKLYFKIPYGELQVGTAYRSITVWFRGNVYRIKKPKVS